MRLFKSASSAIMLRPANQAWASGFSEALADCVVYWGCLDELEECKFRISHPPGLIVISFSQRQLLAQDRTFICDYDTFADCRRKDTNANQI